MRKPRHSVVTLTLRIDRPLFTSPIKHPIKVQLPTVRVSVSQTPRTRSCTTLYIPCQSGYHISAGITPAFMCHEKLIRV